MPQDTLERVQVFLSQTQANRFAMLLDLTKLLPDSLLQRAIWLAKNSTRDAVTAFLIHALAKRLPTKSERIQLTNSCPLPQGIVVKELSLPEGRKAKRLIAQLSEEQRYLVFDQFFVTLEAKGGGGLQVDMFRKTISDAGEHTGTLLRGKKKGAKPKVEGIPIVFDDQPGGVASVDAPDDQGGGGTAYISPVEVGYEPADDDEGFEAMPGSAAPPPTPAPQEPAETGFEAAPRRDLVNLGFAHTTPADKKVKPTEALQTGHSYFFWFKIGAKEKDAIGEDTHIDLTKLPEEANLTVALFGFENELAISPGADTGELKIQKDGSVKVLRQVGNRKKFPLSPEAEPDYLETHLLFPISVPLNQATHRLRCNIYCAQVLVQSYVMSAHVKAKPETLPEAFDKKLDYVLSDSLRASHLKSMTEEPHLLSLMVNDNGNGTHGFRFFGDDGTETFKDDAQIDGPEIGGFLTEARQAMHKVSWGNVDPWDPAKPLAYRYQSGTFDKSKLAKDLAFLARAGWSIFDGFASHLTKSIDELQEVMANPGMVQIALKLSPRVVVPAAIIYDYNWAPDTYDFATTEFQLCPTFSAAIDQARAGGPPLEECDCFKGKCAFKAMIIETTSDPEKSVSDLPPMVCPSGFWGYRHALGLPLTLDGTHKDIPPVITFKDDLQMVAAVSTDPKFIERDPHLGRLKKLKLNFERDESYKAVVKRLKTSTPQFIYFYCHGGIRANNNRPYLEIGVDDRLGPESLPAEKIKWAGPNPLVFINGCHTIALNPEVSLNFVSAFVQQSGAAGVIGTEITIFEPLAAKFAEECFARFVGADPHKASMPIGKAVRGARLELLKDGNPLGLVYIPYAVASLRLEQQN